MFDIESYLSDARISYEINGNELNMDCLVCKREKHFYYNRISNLGICHRCNFGCNHLTFLMLGLGFSKKDAVEAVFGRSDRSLSSIQGYFKKLLVASEEKDDHLNTSIPFFRNPLPSECEEINKDNFPKALAERKIGLELANKVRAKVCNNIGRYFNRIIFPVESLKTKTFVAQTGFTKEKTRKVKTAFERRGKNFRKTLFPYGSLMSEVLYLYNSMKDKEGDLFIVEGVMDVLRLVRSEKYTMGLFGSSVSDSQAILLSYTKADRLFLMLDGDVPTEKTVKYTKKLITACPKKEVRTCIIPDKKDPDDLDDTELQLVIDNSLSWLQLKLLEAKG